MRGVSEETEKIRVNAPNVTHPDPCTKREQGCSLDL